MAQEITNQFLSGLLAGPSALQAAEQQQAIELAKLTPMQQSAFAGISTGQAAARGLRGMFNVKTPDETRMDVRAQARKTAASEAGGDRLKFLESYANALDASGDAEGAFQARSILDQERMKAAESSATVFQRQAAGTASLATATRERNVGALEQADRIRLQELQARFGEVEGARRFREERDIAGERKAAATVPPPAKQFGAEVSLRTDFLKEVKPIDDALSSLDRTEALLNEQSGLADAVAKRQFSKFAGDRDISNKDVAAFGNFGPLGQRLGGILSQFFEGTYSDAQREEALRIVRNLRDPLDKQRTEKERDFSSAARRQQLPEEAIRFVAPTRTRGLRALPTQEGTAAPATITLPSGNKARPL
jgi:hypothetical protein